MLRVIAGELRGRKFAAPGGTRTRPTSDRVRESLFNLLGPLPRGSRVLDLFAGSGALGIEALSRGARHATFVEKERTALTALRGNLRALDLVDRTTVVPADVFRDAMEPAGGPFDRIFADPPYGADLSGPTLLRAAAWMAEDGVVVLEHAAAEPLPEPPEPLALWKSRRYGGTIVSLFARIPEEDS